MAVQACHQEGQRALKAVRHEVLCDLHERLAEGRTEAHHPRTGRKAPIPQGHQDCRHRAPRPVCDTLERRTDMFITDNDYRVVIGENALKVVSQASQDVRDNAELEACEEISGYLRPKYDTEAVFSAEGESRNRLVVMYAADIALYHMIAAMPQKMGSEIRKERYERAVKWLEGVQAGRIIPDLPLATDGDGTPTGDLLLFGSQKQLRHNW